MISSQPIIEKEIQGFIGFFKFWYIAGPVWFWQQNWQTVSNFESVFATRAMLQHISEPIFQDYTRAGRVIGVVVRILRTILGLVLYAMVIAIFTMAAAIWLIAPPFAVWQVLRLGFSI